jgi:hypothetical protein
VEEKCNGSSPLRIGHFEFLKVTWRVIDKAGACLFSVRLYDASSTSTPTIIAPHCLVEDSPPTYFSVHPIIDATRMSESARKKQRVTPPRVSDGVTTTGTLYADVCACLGYKETC